MAGGTARYLLLLLLLVLVLHLPSYGASSEHNKAARDRDSRVHCDLLQSILW